MVLAAACGLWDSRRGAGLNPAQVALVGARDIDPAERELLDASGIRTLTPAESTPAAISSFVGDRPVWIHEDREVLEPGYIPAAYKAPDGLYPHQIAAIFSALPRESIRGIELTEFEAGETETPGRLSMELILETLQLLVRP